MLFLPNYEQKTIERETYSLFDMTGDLGGIISIISYIISSFVLGFSETNLNSLFGKSLFYGSPKYDYIVSKKIHRDTSKK